MNWKMLRGWRGKAWCVNGRSFQTIWFTYESKFLFWRFVRTSDAVYELIGEVWCRIEGPRWTPEAMQELVPGR